MIKYSHIIICMATPYRTSEFISASILAIAILGSTAKLIPINISGYTVSTRGTIINSLGRANRILSIITAHMDFQISDNSSAINGW